MGLSTTSENGLRARWRGDTSAAGAGGIAWMPSSPARQGAGSRNCSSRRFRATAGDQPDTRGHDWLSGLRIRLRGAYTPSLPITERRLFAGRVKVLTELIRAIEDERLHTVVFGERGLGKTSLLHVLAQTARDARYLVIYITCGAASNSTRWLAPRPPASPCGTTRTYGPTSPEAERGDTFAELLGEEPISVRTPPTCCPRSPEPASWWCSTSSTARDRRNSAARSPNW